MWKTKFVSVATLLFALQKIYPCGAHDFGFHGLIEEDPTGDPVLPEITGPFRLVMDVLFLNTIDETDFHSLFHWTTTDYTEAIYLGHRNRVSTGERTVLRVTVGNATTECSTTDDLSINTMYRFSAEVKADGTASISIGGFTPVTCTGMNVPTNIPRAHHSLGKSPLDGTSGYVHHHGGISGLQLYTPGTPSAHPRERFKAWNFPGQPFGNGFVVSFYARFDDLGVVSQRVFDFNEPDSTDTNAEGSESLWCINQGSGSSYSVMSCWVRVGDNFDNYGQIDSEIGGIEEGVWAYWHFGVNADGTFFLHKDNVNVADYANNRVGGVNDQHSGSDCGSHLNYLPTNVFRPGLKFLQPNNDKHQESMRGVVLGLRLDREHAS